MLDARAKWDRRHGEAPPETPPPAWILRDNKHLLPSSGRALDLACGLGGNALELARQGLDVSAWDVSPVALNRLTQHALGAGWSIACCCVDLATEVFPGTGFDVIVVSRYWDRSLAPDIIAALNPGGLLYYQTFVREKRSASGPSNPFYLLHENELLDVFAPLRVRYYREDARAGELAIGQRDEAGLVAQKPR